MKTALMKTARSKKLFAQAVQILPGGVDSPVRAFKAVGASPLFIKRASGSRLVDVDGNTFIDYVMSWGPLIHGHAPGGLVKALAAPAGQYQLRASPLEVELATRVRRLMPSLERVGSSAQYRAAMSAIRVARGDSATRSKFGQDGTLTRSSWRGGDVHAGTPTSPGVTAATMTR